MIKITKDCMACGQCAEICPEEAIKPMESAGYSQYTVDQDLCVLCYTCFDEVDCPGEAIISVNDNLEDYKLHDI